MLADPNISGAGGLLVGDYSVRVRKAGVFSIPHAGWTPHTWDIEDFDTANLFDTGSNTRLVAPITGKYTIHGQVYFTGNNTGDRGLCIGLNGAGTFANATRIGETYNDNPGTTGWIMEVMCLIDLTKDDYVELFCYQTSGSALNSAVIAEANPQFSMICLAL